MLSGTYLCGCVPTVSLFVCPMPQATYPTNNNQPQHTILAIWSKGNRPYLGVSQNRGAQQIGGFLLIFLSRPTNRTVQTRHTSIRGGWGASYDQPLRGRNACGVGGRSLSLRKARPGDGRVRESASPSGWPGPLEPRAQIRFG